MTKAPSPTAVKVENRSARPAFGVNPKLNIPLHSMFMRRVLIAAAAICTLSFVAGVAGDLTPGARYDVAEAAVASVEIPALAAPESAPAASAQTQPPARAIVPEPMRMETKHRPPAPLASAKSAPKQPEKPAASVRTKA